MWPARGVWPASALASLGSRSAISSSTSWTVACGPASRARGARPLERPIRYKIVDRCRRRPASAGRSGAAGFPLCTSTPPSPKMRLRLLRPLTLLASDSGRRTRPVPLLGGCCVGTGLPAGRCALFAPSSRHGTNATDSDGPTARSPSRSEESKGASEEQSATTSSPLRCSLLASLATNASSNSATVDSLGRRMVRGGIDDAPMRQRTVTWLVPPPSTAPHARSEATSASSAHGACVELQTGCLAM